MKLSRFACLALVPLAALAQPVTSDLRLGEQVAVKGGGNEVTACNTCHGDRGQGMPAADFPRLAGQPREYLHKQLEAYADGRRGHPIMGTIAKAMSPAQREATAAWYAQLQAPAAKAPAGAGDGKGLKDQRARLARGRQLAEAGDERLVVQACANCHGPGGSGVAPEFPYLAGQDAEYLRSTLEAFRGGQRRTDDSGQMMLIARHMNEHDLAAVAAYFAAQPPPAPAAARVVRLPDVPIGGRTPAAATAPRPAAPQGASGDTSGQGSTQGPGGAAPQPLPGARGPAK